MKCSKMSFLPCFFDVGMTSSFKTTKIQILNTQPFTMETDFKVLLQAIIFLSFCYCISGIYFSWLECKVAVPNIKINPVNLLTELDMHFLKKLEETFNSGDPVVRDWFLVGNNYLPFMLCLGYVTMTLVGPPLMKNRKPFDLRKIMVVFNFSVVLVYAIGITLVAYYLPMVPWEMFCRGGLLIQGEPAYLLVSTGWVVYLLRYIEFFDTAFFILRKKEHLVSFLHVFHHTIVPILGWIMFRTERSALQSIPILLNAFVHVIMYTYYGLAAMGPKVRKYLWWKKYLTQLQMVQFFLMIVYVMVVVPYTGCTMVTFSYLMDITLAPLFLFLFYRFYKMKFTPSVKKTE